MAEWMIWLLAGLVAFLFLGWALASQRANQAEAEARVARRDQAELERHRAEAEGLKAAYRIAVASHAAEHELAQRLMTEKRRRPWDAP